MSAAGQDIHERFFNILPTLMCVLDTEGRFVECNAAWQTQLGFASSEMTGRSCLDFVHPEDRGLVSEHKKKIANGVPQALFEARFVCKDGTVKWLYMRCAADREKNFLYAVATDITPRKLTEDALRESEATLRKIIDKAPLAMSIVAFDGTIEYINQQAVRTFGYQHQDIPNMERWWMQAYPEKTYREEVVGTWMGRVRKAIEEKSAIEGAEFRVTCKDGAVKTCFIFGVVAAGKVFVMFDDITRRVNAENALRESGRTLHQILEQAPVCIAIHGLDGKFELINRKFTQTFGYKPEDIPTLESWAKQAYPEESYRKRGNDIWSSWIEKSIRTGQEMEGGEFRVVCKDGSVKTVFITGVVTADKKVVSLLDDITVRLETEKALRERESLYRALIETTGTGYVVIDGRGNVVDANQEYVRLSGHSDLKQILGRSVIEWTAPQEKERNAAAVAQCARDGHIFNFEVDYIDKAGKTTPIEVNATVVSRSGVPHILTLCRDIASRRNTEAELLALNQGLERRVEERTSELSAANMELTMEIAHRIDAERSREKLQQELVQSQKMEVVGQLAGGISHDFNNILVAISGYAEFLMKTLPEGAPARDDLNEIVRETERGALLTRQLITISRQQPLELKVLSLNAAVEDACRMLRRLIGSNMRLHLRLAPDLDSVKADQGQISQVIMNLVINARDAMPDGGDITLVTANEEVSGGLEGMPLTPPAGNHVTLSVTDTGTGMPAETASRIFEPFFTTKPSGKGTGLGLSTVYGIVHQAQGGIAMKTAPGKGTTLKIYFPRTSEKA